MNNQSHFSALLLTTFSLIWSGLQTGCNLREGTRIEHYRAGGLYFGGGPSPSPDGGVVIYSSPTTGNGDVYEVALDGTNITRLTSDPSYEGDADYSPDGKQIVFIRDGDRGADIWIMNSDGSCRRQLSKNRGDVGGPRLSPDGTHLVFWGMAAELVGRLGSTAARELYVIDLASGGETRLTNNEIEDVYPAFSADGSWIAFTRDSSIWRIEIDGTNERRIASGFQPSLSPDGQYLAVVGGKHGRQIDLIAIDGSLVRTLYAENTTVSHPAFLPDCGSVVFLERTPERGVGDVVIIGTSGGKVRRITHID